MTARQTAAIERPSRAPCSPEPVPYSREYFLARLGPEVVADIDARVAAAPPPSAQKVEEIRRLFAAVPPAHPAHAA